MAASRILTQAIVRDGITPTFENANADGHTFEPGPTTFLEFVNGGGSPIIALIGQRPDRWTEKTSLSETLILVTVAAGARSRVGPLHASRFRLASGAGAFAWFSTPTSVTVAVFDL